MPFLRIKRASTAGALHSFEVPVPRAELAAFSLADLSLELLARLSQGETYQRDRDLVLAGQLQDRLDARLDVHLNRFSRRRLYDLARPILDRTPLSALKGATIVDLGCGSLNPFVLGFLFLMLGAQRAYAIDLEPPQDPARAVRALATAASWMLIDPMAVIGPDVVSPASVLQHLEGFDLRALAAGSPDGIATERLVHRIEPVESLSLRDEEADLVTTVSLLEHVERIDDALESLRRITRRGGAGHHIVDFVDHRLYAGEVDSPHAFLTLDDDAPLVHGCNRIRCGEMCARFERHGFTVDEVEPIRIEAVDEREQRRFVPPFRSMSPDDLQIVCARIVVRRR